MSREQFWFLHPLRVRYSEVDAQGVVFNAHCLTYFDTAVIEYFRALGYDQLACGKQSGVDFHVVKSVVEYKVPLLFDQELEIGARVARIGNSSLVFALGVFPKGSGEVLAIGEIVFVSTDRMTHRTVPVSGAVRSMIASRESNLSKT